MGCASSQATVPIDDIIISIFGIDNAGKTCLLRSLAGNFEFDAVPTVGLGQESFMYNDIKLTVYDLGGSANFRSVWERFYAAAWGFIWVVDASDEARIQESKDTLIKMLQHEFLKGKPFIVVANKQDKPGAIRAVDLKKKMELPKKVQVVDAIVTQPNVEEKKPNAGVSQALDSLINSIIADYPKLAAKRQDDIKKQEEINEREKAEKRARIEKARAEREAKAAAEANAAAESNAAQ